MAKSQSEPVVYNMGNDRESPALTTMVFRLYHQQPGGDVNEWMISSTLEGRDSNQSMSRTLEIEEDWMDLDFAWVDEPKFIWIENQTGNDFRARPSEEKLAEIAKAIIEVAPNKIYVHPNTVNVITPMDNSPIRVRSCHGKVKLKYAALPK